MLEFRDRPLARVLGSARAAHVRLDITLHLMKGCGHGFAMCRPHAIVVAHDGGEGDGFRCTEGRIPSGAVLGGLAASAFLRSLELHQWIAGFRVKTFRQALELLVGHRAGETHLFGQLPLPLAGRLLVLGVVSLLAIGVVAGVILLRLTRIERFRNFHHNDSVLAATICSRNDRSNWFSSS